MDESPRTLAPWMLALCLVTVAGGGGCRSSVEDSAVDADPEALFAEAEELRLAYEKEASHRAIRKYGDARAAWVRRGERARAAAASRMLGMTREQLGLLGDAYQDYLEAASLCEGSCEPLPESAIRSRIGFTQAKLADSEESQEAALRECERALSLSRDAGGSREVAEALTCAGEVEYHRGKYDKALELYRQAISGWEGADPRVRAEILFYEGTVRSDLSQFVEARANLEEALSLWTSSKDARGEAMALVSLGQLDFRQGKYQNALNQFRQALDRLEPIGDLVWEASGLAGIGAVYSFMGNEDRARSYWEAALERSQKAGIQVATWELLLILGRSHLTLENPSEALKRFKEALALAKRMASDRWKQAYSLHHLSLAHQAVGDGEESLECLEHALQLQQSLHDARLEAAIQLEMGNTHELLLNRGRAAESFRRSLELSRAASDRVGEATALFGLARAANGRNDVDAAREYLERSLEVTESLRADVESRELRTSYFASIYRLHELYVDVLMRLDAIRPRAGLAAAAFEASEAARARSLLESLTEAGIDIRAGVDPRLLEREASLKRDLGASVERRVRPKQAGDGTEGEAQDREIQDLEAKYDLAVAEIRSKSARYSALTRRKALGVEKVQKELLDDDTLLLEYALGEKRSFLWAISRKEFASFELPPREEIEGEAERLYDLLTARGQVLSESLQERNLRVVKADGSSGEVAARLGRVLLGPVANKIAGNRIVVVTDGALQSLPFGALPVPGSGSELVPLLVEHEVVNLPSASALSVLRQEAQGRKRPEGSVAVFADPVFESGDSRLAAREAVGRESGTTNAGEDPSSETSTGIGRVLPGGGPLRSGDSGIARLEATRREATSIIALAPVGTTFQAIDFDATRTAAVSGELGRYRIVHFATHGVSNVETPAMSGVVLSMFDRQGLPQDGFLRLHDIYDLRLSADLVVLSACSTALGKQIQGEGNVGIARAFLYAGAERVVATLWKVDDEATQELMTHFYRGMLERHLSPPAALRAAQLAIRGMPQWRSPFFWAAFVLQGEWRDG